MVVLPSGSGAALVFLSSSTKVINMYLLYLRSNNFKINPFRTAVLFRGQLGTNDLGFEWCGPKTGLKGLR